MIEMHQHLANSMASPAGRPNDSMRIDHEWSLVSDAVMVKVLHG
jgi:hypothetical protein